MIVKIILPLLLVVGICVCAFFLQTRTIEKETDKSLQKAHEAALKYCSDYFRRLCTNPDGSPDFPSMNERDRAFMLAFYIAGFVQVNDFEELIETTFEPDPDYSQTVEAFIQVGFPELGNGLRQLVQAGKGRNKNPANMAAFKKMAKALDNVLLDEYDRKTLYPKMQKFLTRGGKKA